jgi:hypothetical protein
MVPDRAANDRLDRRGATRMRILGRLISSLALASTSTFGVWVMAMEYANFSLGIPLAARLVMMAAAMGLVGLGFGARTARIQRSLPPVLPGVLPVFPLAAWRAYQFAVYHAGDPALSRLWLREFAIMVFTMVVPCVAGFHWIWLMARKSGMDGTSSAGNSLSRVPHASKPDPARNERHRCACRQGL